MVQTRKKRQQTKTKSRAKRSRSKRVFKKADFYSGDGFMTSVWGPPQWHMLHTISFNYPNQPTEDDKRYYRDFILSLTHVLPCKVCRRNFKTNLEQLPLSISDMQNRESFSRYIYRMHELVNKMLHKKSSLSYCDVRERYEHFRARCTASPPIVFKHGKSKTRRNSKSSYKHENGCTVPLYGTKSRCILNIVPQGGDEQSIQIDKKCTMRR